MYRSILEGMACDIRMITEAMIKPLPENLVQRIHCIGGESQNRMLMQIKAAVLKHPLQRLNTTEAVSLGAALLGGMGAGLFKILEEALGGLKYGAESIEPEPDREIVSEPIFPGNEEKALPRAIEVPL